MRKLLRVLPALLLLIGATSASAAIKVGIVDLPQILQQSPQVAALNQQLKNQFASQQQTILAAQNKLRTEAGQLSSATGAAKQKLQQQVMNDQKQFQQMVVNYQANVSSAQTRAINTIMAQVTKAVSGIAQKQGLDIVLAKPAVMYAPSTVDITSAVVQAMPTSAPSQLK